MSRTRTASLLAAVAIAAVIVGFFVQRYVNGTGGSPLLGKPRLDFRLQDTDGRVRALSEWDGKILIVNFWATWCPPCRKEIPDFVDLQNKYGAQGVQFIGVALDNPEDLRSFMREIAVNYPILVDREEKSLSYDYGNDLGVLPYTVVIDRKGVVTATRQGRFHKVEAEATIRELL